MSVDSNTAQKAEALRQVTALAADLSGYEAGELNPSDNFFQLGFDSLFMTQLATAFSREFDVQITFGQLFEEFPTLGAVADYVSQHGVFAATTDGEVGIGTTDNGEQELLLEPASLSSPTNIPEFVSSTVASVGTDSDLQRIFTEQLNLMSQQLELLNSARQQQTGRNKEKHTIVKPAVAAPDPKEVKPAMPAGFGPGKAAEPTAVTEAQREHIERLVARYNTKTAGSKKHTQENRFVHADPRTAAGFNPLWKEMVYPLVVKKSRGAYLWDVDDNQYIDILNGFGPNFFGHNAPFITEALRAQLSESYEVGPQTPGAGDAARLLCELTGMDRVSWVNTGSEAVQAAIRISRTVTGRDKIVVFSGDYHGNFDEVLVRGTKTSRGHKTIPMAPGIPFDSVGNVLVLDYGTEEALSTIRQHSSEIAAVLVEPVQSRRPDFQPREFLHALRAMTLEQGIVLIFDEVITGFRSCPGGAQEYFGIEADLATYGKIIGGGMPIGVVAGRSKFMDTFDGGMWEYGDDSRPSAGVTFFAGTFVRHPLAITAAHASLQYLKSAGPAFQDGINRKATRLAATLNDFFLKREVDIQIPQFSSQMFIRLQDTNEFATLFFYHLRDKGIHVLEGFPSYISAAHTDQDIDQIINAVQESVLEMQADGLLSSGKLVPAIQPKTYPLTEAQSNMWLVCQIDEDASCAFNESVTLKISGKLDQSLFRQSVLDSLYANEAFQLNIDEDGEYQCVNDRIEHTIEDIDFSDLYTNTTKAELQKFLAKRAARPFQLDSEPLAKASLIRMSTEEYYFVLYCHHIIFDGFSSESLTDEISGRYTAAVSGATYQAPAKPQFHEYVRKAISHDTEAATDYWVEELGDAENLVVDLPVDKPRKSERAYNGATFYGKLNRDLVRDIRDIARKSGVSVNTVLCAAFSVLASKLSGEDDFVVSVPAAGQAFHDSSAIGFCVNMMPIRTNPDARLTFGEFAISLQSKLIKAVTNQNFQVNELIERLSIRKQDGRLALSELVFNHSKYHTKVSLPDCSVEAEESPRQYVYYDLFFQVLETTDDMDICVEYASSIYEEQTIARWVGHYECLLKDITLNFQAPLEELILHSGNGQANALVGERRDNTKWVSVHSLIEDATSRFPGNRAVTCEGKTLTFEELNRRANRLARILERDGVGSDDTVGVLIERSLDMIVSMIAIWKCGAAYIPLDPEFPIDRLNYMVADSGTRLVVSNDATRDVAQGISTGLLMLEEVEEMLHTMDASNLDHVVCNGDSRAYVIYTSGSTGQPKGVENTHEATLNFLLSMQEQPGLESTDILLSVTTISFDISILELFLPLTTGAETIIATADQYTDGFELCDLIEEHSVTVMQATPVTWRILLDSDWEGHPTFKALCGGEAMPSDVAGELLEKIGELWNMYGPTETTVWSSCELITDPNDINVGTPIANTTMYILDDHKKPVPVGVPGDLWIGGSGVASGYLGREELTSERFLTDHICPDISARMYSTGDRAYVRADGKLDVLGRQDNQIKLRGYRIELGEIEAVLVGNNTIEQAAMAVREDQTGQPMLCAFVVRKAGSEETHSEWRQWLRKSVPGYMIPQVFVELDEMPLTNNKKIDRKALPDIHAGEYVQSIRIEPRTDEEQLIASLWKDILEIENVSVTDNFFELGGQSLQVVKMAALLRKHHGYRISPRAVIFETLEQIAASVDRIAS